MCAWVSFTLGLEIAQARLACGSCGGRAIERFPQAPHCPPATRGPASQVGNQAALQQRMTAHDGEVQALRSKRDHMLGSLATIQDNVSSSPGCACS